MNTRDRDFTRASIQRRMEQVEASIARYMAALETADRHDGEMVETKGVRLKEKIAALREQMRDFRALEMQVHVAPDQQISLTDPDARAMATNGKGTGVVGYNVQTAVDAKHHLIVAYEVTNVGHDRGQLANMAAQAKAEMGVESLNVLADRGYFSGKEVLACEALDVIPYVPRPLTSGAKADGRFGKQDFVYIPDQDVYRCPAGELLARRMTTVEKGQTLHRYWNLSSCRTCPLKAQCTPAKERRITRWEHEAVIEAMQQRLDRMPKAMRIRRATVEHPFGTLKAWMGATHFRTPDARKGPNRDEPSRPGLQSEAGDRHPRRPAADGGNAGLSRPPRLLPKPHHQRPASQGGQPIKHPDLSASAFPRPRWIADAGSFNGRAWSRSLPAPQPFRLHEAIT